jgi:hypothetical protein
MPFPAIVLIININSSYSTHSKYSCSNSLILNSPEKYFCLKYFIALSNLGFKGDFSIFDKVFIEG